MKVLILGGYGTFGGRLARLLADEGRLTLVIAGRSHAKAAEFASQLPAGASTLPLRFDRDADVRAQLQSMKPDVLVDATGPFQSYGHDPYRVVRACVELGIHYLDLADGARFVEGIAQFDDQAKARGVYVLSGVSSFPVLTVAVVRHLSGAMAKVMHIQAGIAPSPYAGVGLNVIRAISGYAGKPLPVARDGRQDRGYALTDTMRYTISPPGYLPLRNTRFSLVEVPDLHVLPKIWPGLDTVWIGAGPVPEILHRALSGFAWLVRLRVLPSLSPFARIFHFMTNVFRWGEHRGGMFVLVRGRSVAGEPLERSWHMVAEGDDGPYIPSMAVEAIVRRALDGKQPAAGARPCLDELTLADYENLFNKRKIVTGERVGPSVSSLPLYAQILGDAWNRLDAPVREMHEHTGHLEAEGNASVERGHRWLASLVAWVFGFPPSAENVRVKVRFQSYPGAEVWERTFGTKSFSSTQFAGRGRFAGLLCERFGPFSVGLALVLQDGKLMFIVRGWSFLGVPLPAFLAPCGDSYEHAKDGRFHFSVEIGHPITGLIVRYRGWLIPSMRS